MLCHCKSSHIVVKMCVSLILIPVLALVVFYDAHIPYQNYWIGRLAIRLGLVEIQ